MGGNGNTFNICLMCECTDVQLRMLHIQRHINGIKSFTTNVFKTQGFRISVQGVIVQLH